MRVCKKTVRKGDSVSVCGGFWCSSAAANGERELKIEPRKIITKIILNNILSSAKPDGLLELSKKMKNAAKWEFKWASVDNRALWIIFVVAEMKFKPTDDFLTGCRIGCVRLRWSPVRSDVWQVDCVIGDRSEVAAEKTIKVFFLEKKLTRCKRTELGWPVN